MLEVPDIQCIRVMIQRGVSIREVARHLRVSRKTVRKYAAQDFVVDAEPKAKLTRGRPAPRMDAWKPVLECWVAEDEGVPRKQRRTARKMHRQLVEEYRADVSEASVRRYVAQLKGRRAREAFVPLEFQPGSMMEVDFGHAMVILEGVRQTLPFIAVRLMYSSVSFVKMFPHSKLEAWLDGLVSALSFFGGSALVLLFDNDTAFVREILAHGRRLQAPEFMALAAHYGTEMRFANPGRGNEKGGVEHLVQWAQRNLFSPVPEAGSLDELNGRLQEQCLRDTERRHRNGRTVMALWEEEGPHLGRLPAVPFIACRRRFARVDKTLLVSYEGVRYSVPAEYAQKALTMRVFWDRIEVADQERTVAVHARRAAGAPPSLQLAHYLPVLARKPRAVEHAAVISQGDPEITRFRDAFLASRPEAVRELVAILELSTEVGLADLTATLALANRHHAYDLESVRALLTMRAEPEIPAPLPSNLLERWPQ
ncbi:MAG: IS21 family transposase, partial [Clostridia bacterium]